ncbi:hypothetical protein ES703_116824 [subsurface metagenome]
MTGRLKQLADKYCVRFRVMARSVSFLKAVKSVESVEWDEVTATYEDPETLSARVDWDMNNYTHPPYGLQVMPTAIVFLLVRDLIALDIHVEPPDRFTIEGVTYTVLGDPMPSVIMGGESIELAVGVQGA